MCASTILMPGKRSKIPRTNCRLAASPIPIPEVCSISTKRWVSMNRSSESGMNSGIEHSKALLPTRSKYGFTPEKRTPAAKAAPHAASVGAGSVGCASRKPRTSGAATITSIK